MNNNLISDKDKKTIGAIIATSSTLIGAGAGVGTIIGGPIGTLVGSAGGAVVFAVSVAAYAVKKHQQDNSNN